MCFYSRPPLMRSTHMIQKVFVEDLSVYLIIDQFTSHDTWGLERVFTIDVRMDSHIFFWVSNLLHGAWSQSVVWIPTSWSHPSLCWYKNHKFVLFESASEPVSVTASSEEESDPTHLRISRSQSSRTRLHRLNWTITSLETNLPIKHAHYSPFCQVIIKS